jgi:putative DNA primase/helicase
VPEPRLSYGPIWGAAVRLAPPGETLLIGEGIETALSGQQETGIPAWAAISASNMLNLVLPELPLASLVIIAADADAAGLEAARRTAETWVRQGRRVKIAYPPAGQDLNDLLRGGS